MSWMSLHRRLCCMTFVLWRIELKKSYSRWNFELTACVLIFWQSFDKGFQVVNKVSAEGSVYWWEESLVLLLLTGGTQQTLSLKTVEGQRSLRCGDKCLENIPFKLIFLQTNIKILS